MSALVAPPATDGAPNQVLAYRCGACRRHLFDATDVVHGHDGEKCGSFVLEEPLAWMTQQLQGDGGRLCCECGAKVGHWSWTGMRCGCGEWLAPAFAVAKSKVDGRAAKSRSRGEASGVQERLGVSLPWLRVDPPRRVVVYIGDGDRDAAKNSVDAAWANRAVREAFWLFLGADAAPEEVSALIREVHARGVADVVAAGAGRGAAVVSAVECESVVLIAPPADVSLRARRALVCCAKGDDRSWGDATVEVFADVDATAPPAGVVRALCTFVSQE